MDEYQGAKSVTAMSDSESDEDKDVVSNPLPGHRAQNEYFKKLYVSVLLHKTLRCKELTSERS